MLPTELPCLVFISDQEGCVKTIDLNAFFLRFYVICAVYKSFETIGSSVTKVDIL